jgi:RecB family exonuclease
VRPNPHLNLETLPIGGLTPQAWIVVETGVNREDVKDFFLKRGVGFSAQSILDLPGFCRQILGALVDSSKILSSSARLEVLRKLVAQNQGAQPEMKRLRRQKNFFKKLDRSIQSARLSYSSQQEKEAQFERLAMSQSNSPIRDELNQIIFDYEKWLQDQQAWDQPRLLLAALAVLSAAEIDLDLPEKICVLSPHRGESRAEAFWEVLEKRVSLDRIVLSELELRVEDLAESITTRVSWEEWHTIDDAVERLADTLLEEVNVGSLNLNGVLMPDLPMIRRSFLRALKERGIELKDPRDPTQLRLDEGVKAALSPLELVARRFSQEAVLSFLHSGWTQFSEQDRKIIHQEIQDRGILDGLASYREGKLSALYLILEKLASSFTSRLNISQVMDTHLQLIKNAMLENPKFPVWIFDFFQETWEKFKADLVMIGEVGRKAPLLYWVERIKERLEDATPPIQKLQWQGGLELFRLGQVPLQYPEKLWCLGIPARWTTSEVGGDYWLSEREREILSGHFLVRSGVQESLDRRRILLGWCLNADQVTFLDATYDWDGRERESVEPLLKELGLKIPKSECRSYSKWIPGFSHPQTHPPRDLDLGKMETKLISASDLERFSRCPFQGVAFGRWRLKESEPSKLEMRADARGILLHETVKILMQNRLPEGGFLITPAAALDQAWTEKNPKGFFKSERLKRYAQDKLIPVLESFCLDEVKYQAQSQTRVLSLEGPELQYAVSGIHVRGFPDRIDEHAEGLIVVDYKTGSDSPVAQNMLDLGYRLQLPVYALAASQTFSKNPLALQFIELKKKNSRARGLFFKKNVGKEPGKITQTRSKNSIVDLDESETWTRLAEQIKIHVDSYLGGSFYVAPKKISPKEPFKECDSCRARDACGQRRFPDSSSDSDELEGVE